MALTEAHGLTGVEKPPAHKGATTKLARWCRDTKTLAEAAAAMGEQAPAPAEVINIEQLVSNAIGDLSDYFSGSRRPEIRATAERACKALGLAWNPPGDHENGMRTVAWVNETQALLRNGLRARA